MAEKSKCSSLLYGRNREVRAAMQEFWSFERTSRKEVECSCFVSNMRRLLPMRKGRSRRIGWRVSFSRRSRTWATPSGSALSRSSADPGNTKCQRDLSVSDEKIGGTLQVQGDLAGALVQYRAELAMMDPLARRAAKLAQLHYFGVQRSMATCCAALLDDINMSLYVPPHRLRASSIDRRT